MSFNVKLNFALRLLHNVFWWWMIIIPNQAASLTVANAPVPVTANTNIKAPVDLQRQLRRRPGTLIFTYIYLMYLMILFLCIELKKVLVSWYFFFNLTNIFFLPVLRISKLDDGIPVIQFFRTSSTGAWTTNKFDEGLPVTKTIIRIS